MVIGMLKSMSPMQIWNYHICKIMTVVNKVTSTYAVIVVAADDVWRARSGVRTDVSCRMSEFWMKKKGQLVTYRSHRCCSSMHYLKSRRLSEWSCPRWGSCCFLLFKLGLAWLKNRQNVLPPPMLLLWGLRTGKFGNGISPKEGMRGSIARGSTSGPWAGDAITP